MTSPIRACVLGVGLAGLVFHIPFILALPDKFTLHAVLERNPKSEGGTVKERFGVTTKIYTTLEDVLKDREIELIVVGTPSDTHYAYAKAALEAGKHVLVDKPVTSTSAEAKELGALAKSKGLILYAYQNRRWDADFLALRRLLAEPPTSPYSLGDLVEFESHYDRFRTDLAKGWKALNLPGSGQIYDLGTHLIDQAVALFGRPAKLTAFLRNTRGIGHPDVDDTFDVYLHYPSSKPHSPPLTVILRAHILSVRSPQLRYIVRGTRGTFVKHGVDTQEPQLKEMSDPVRQMFTDEKFGRDPEEEWGFVEHLTEAGTVVKTVWPSKDPGQYIELYRNLFATLKEGAEHAIIKWEEACSVIELVELARLSSKEGCTVTVPTN